MPDQNQTKSSNLIVGAVCALRFGEIAPFIFSLRRCGYRGRLLLFVQDIDEKTREQLHMHGVLMQELEAPEVVMAVPVNCLRYFAYQQMLRDFPGEEGFAMLADVRDVVFQHNPFDFPVGDRLCCFLEPKGLTIGSNIINAGWVAAAYGKAVLNEMANCPISCSGTTIGPLPRIREYVDQMVDGLRAISERIPFIMHVMGGVDQAVHNYLLHRGVFPKAKLFTNEEGPVLTMNYMRQNDLRVVDGQFLSEDGGAVHVLHQYDRDAATADYVLKTLGLLAPPVHGETEGGSP